MPRAYFYPYPQEKTRFLLESIRLCTGPHAISLMISSLLSKKIGSLLELHEFYDNLLIMFEILDS